MKLVGPAFPLKLWLYVTAVTPALPTLVLFEKPEILIAQTVLIGNSSGAAKESSVCW
jgi:hypothetical protein